MTFTPTAQELTRLRRKIGANIPDNGADTDTAFPDSELEDIWDEAGGNAIRAVIICYEALLGDAVKLTKYTSGQTSEERQQIVDHIAKVSIPHYKKELAESVGYKMVGITPIPAVARDTPHDSSAFPPAPHNRRFWWRRRY